MEQELTTYDSLLPCDLLHQLKDCTDLPSPPSVALRIIELARCSTASLGDIADAVSVDPALVTKILRLSNSPLYSQQRKIENIRQAIALLGINGLIVVALSFSLVSALRSGKGCGMDYSHFWRRSLISALCARALGQHLNVAVSEEFFLAGLLQDIGMLALDKIAPHLYNYDDLHQGDHPTIQALEKNTWGIDHALVGGWLLQSWKLPQQFCDAAMGSHNPQIDNCDPKSLMVRCVSVSSTLADVWLHEDQERLFLNAVKVAEKQLDINAEALESVHDTVTTDMPNIESMFDIDLGAVAMESILNKAKETIVLRHLEVTQEADTLRQTNAMLVKRTRDLETTVCRDDLTGIYTRGYLNKVLKDEFTQAKKHHWPISLAFIDLDNFKQVNDLHGHQAGDTMLQHAARVLTTRVRNTDIVVRYGGDEFVVVLPGTNSNQAVVLGEHLVQAFQSDLVALENGSEMAMTISIGIATHSNASSFNTEDDLIRAADRAAYSAKYQGRNQLIVYSADVDTANNQQFFRR